MGEDRKLQVFVCLYVYTNIDIKTSICVLVLFNMYMNICICIKGVYL